MRVKQGAVVDQTDLPSTYPTAGLSQNEQHLPLQFPFSKLSPNPNLMLMGLTHFQWRERYYVHIEQNEEGLRIWRLELIVLL